MTYQQSLDLAELQADMASERYFEAFDADAHPAFLDQLSIQAALARQIYQDISEEGLAH